MVGTSTEAAGSSDTSDMVQRPGGVDGESGDHVGPWWMSISSSSESSEDNETSEVNDASLLQCGDPRVRVAGAPVDGSGSSGRSSPGVQDQSELEHEDLPLPPEEAFPPLEEAMLEARFGEMFDADTSAPVSKKKSLECPHGFLQPLSPFCPHDVGRPNAPNVP